MGEEHRRYRRVIGPYDGSWDGAAGGRNCRIADLSAGGCFVDAFARHEVGNAVTIVVSLAGRQFTLPGTVVHVDRVQGFGVQFAESDATRQLAALLDALQQ